MSQKDDIKLYFSEAEDLIQSIEENILSLEEDFKNDKYRVMISVKSLDEGTNVPSVSTAIIIAGTSVKRQMIQRLGRILRKTKSN